MITRKTFIGLSAAVIAASCLGAFGLASHSVQRPDCPGKITCPLNGELVCKDRCPLGEQVASEQLAEVPTCCGERN